MGIRKPLVPRNHFLFFHHVQLGTNIPFRLLQAVDTNGLKSKTLKWIKFDAAKQSTWATFSWDVLKCHKTKNDLSNLFSMIWRGRKLSKNCDSIFSSSRTRYMHKSMSEIDEGYVWDRYNVRAHKCSTYQKLFP